MPTTSLKLPEDLKQRAAAAAKRLGITPHAFMIEAIRIAATAAEDRARVIAETKKARAETLKKGEGFDADEVHAYFRARAVGKAVARPKAKPWRD
jgi:predicted transcriptional regulator